MQNFATSDLFLFVGYILFVVGIGLWLSRKKGGTETSQDYFLASRSLPWWAVGGSLIASNISTEQMLGMNGSGFAVGLAIGTYELMAAATLLIVAKFFLPVFIKKEIYTMPQFLEERFDGRVRTVLAFFWVSLFVFVNVTSVLYLGSLAIHNLLGLSLWAGILGLVLYSASFSIFGGLKAVVWTDVIQVVVLVFGGLLASYLIVTTVGGGGYLDGLIALYEKVPEKFDMIFTKDITYTDMETGATKSAYDLLPGISVLIGGMWIANLYYWGMNQYIIQRTLAAKSIREAQKGVAFAAFLKLLMPLIVVIPGIAAYVILNDPTAYGYSGEGISKPDEAFPWVLNNFVGPGFKGLVFAALVAAIGSSISSMVNSASTIFTLDIYKPLLKPASSESHLVVVGKLAATMVLLLGALIAPTLGKLEQVFQYIQEYTGFISPGVLVVFLFGLFWRRATANAALTVVLMSIPLSWALQVFVPELPFLDRMGFCFLLLSAIMVGLSLAEQKAGRDGVARDRIFRLMPIMALLLISVPSGFKVLIEDSALSNLFGIVILGLSAIVIAVLLRERRQDNSRAIELDQELFKTDAIFNGAAFAVCAILSVIYALLW